MLTTAALVLTTGVGLFVVGLRRSLAVPAVADAADYLRQLDGDGPLDEFQELLATPFLSRVVKPLGAGVLQRVVGVTPSHYLERVHLQLLHAGLSGSMRAEEVVTAQALAGGLGLLAALAWVAVFQPATRMGVLVLVLLPLAGLTGPAAWLRRRVDERKDRIRKDLSEMLDLLAISVEAGMAFEGALEVVCQHFDAPLAHEFAHTLREMELGLPRRDALQNLKQRTDVPELSNFVLALTQADVLGMPVGRVLRTQAAEMRSKRRQWARERAGKLPVKILFPLVVFIFPAILVVVLGPAGINIYRAL